MVGRRTLNRFALPSLRPALLWVAFNFGLCLSLALSRSPPLPPYHKNQNVNSCWCCFLLTCDMTENYIFDGCVSWLRKYTGTKSYVRIV